MFQIFQNSVGLPRSKPKGTMTTLWFLCVLVFMAAGCGKQNTGTASNSDEEALSQDERNGEEDTSTPLNEGEPPAFYYYFGEKIFLQQVTDRICLKFGPDAAKEQLLAIISSNASLQATSDTYLDGATLRIAVLEAKDGKQIPLSTIEFFKKK